MSEPAWVRIQRKTFTRWCNNNLSKRDLQIDENGLEEGLSDGIMLHNLLEILGNEDILPKPNKRAKMKLQKIENLNSCLKYIKEKGIKLVGIGAEDIHDQKTNLVLGLIWTLILRFMIETYEEEDEEGRSAKQALLEWCNRVLNPQGIVVGNFKDSWQDGRAFCGLVNALEPGTIPLDQCPASNAEGNMDRAFDTALKLFTFPKVLDAVDVIENPDELSIMTYVSYYRAYHAANTAYAPNCYAEGPGLTEGTSGKPAEFTVFAVNEEGQRAQRGGANVKVSIVDDGGKEVGKAKVKDNLDGTYACHYVAASPGVFTLNVNIGKQPIKDSPFRPTVKPGEPKPGNCEASGPGLESAVAGGTAHFTVFTKDSNGTPITEGGAHIVASLQDSKGEVPVSVVDNQDGTYSCSYNPTHAGNAKLSVKVQTQLFGTGDIKNSPFKVIVNPGSPCAAFTEASGPGLLGAVAGVSAPVHVQTKDKFGNNLNAGGAPINATLKSLDGSLVEDVQILDNNDGTYSLNYVPQKAGRYELKVNLDKDPIKDSPTTVVVKPGAPDPLNFEFDGLELDADGRRTLVAGKTDSFHVKAKDAFGNPLTTGGLDLKGSMTGTANVPVMCADNGDGTYAVSYTPVKVGDYKLDIKVNGKPVGGDKNPVSMRVIPGPIDGSHCVASGPGLSKAKVGGGDNNFVVQLKDAYDNDVKIGGCDVEGELIPLDGSSKPVPVVAEDNGNGTYSCSYPGVKKAGKYQLVPKVNGKPIKNAPFEVSVNPGKTSPENTLVSFPEHAVAGKDHIEVTLRDDQKNQLSSGGDNVKAYLLPLTPLEVDASDNGDGTYTVDYPPSLSGDVEFKVKVNGKYAPVGPFNVKVDKNPVKKEQKERARNVLPSTGGILARLLKDANEKEREAILAELERKFS